MTKKEKAEKKEKRTRLYDRHDIRSSLYNSNCRKTKLSFYAPTDVAGEFVFLCETYNLYPWEVLAILILRSNACEKVVET